MPNPESETGIHSRETKQPQEDALSSLLEKLLSSIEIPENPRYEEIKIKIGDNAKSFF